MPPFKKGNPGCCNCGCVAGPGEECICDCPEPIPNNLFTGDGAGSITLTRGTGGYFGSTVVPDVDTYDSVPGSPFSHCGVTGNRDITVTYGLSFVCGSSWTFSVGFPATLCARAEDDSTGEIRVDDPDTFGGISLFHVQKTIAWTCGFPLVFVMPTSTTLVGIAGGPFEIFYPPGVGGTYTIAL